MHGGADGGMDGGGTYWGEEEEEEAVSKLSLESNRDRNRWQRISRCAGFSPETSCLYFKALEARWVGGWVGGGVWASTTPGSPCSNRAKSMSGSSFLFWNKGLEAFLSPTDQKTNTPFLTLWRKVLLLEERRNKSFILE